MVVRVRILSILFMLLLYQPFLRAQEKNVLDSTYTISAEEIPIYKVILNLTEKTGYNFSYNSSFIDDEKMVTLHLKNYALRKIIDTLFQDTSLIYSPIKNHIVIQKKNYSKPQGNILKKNNAPLVVEGVILDQEKQQPIPYTTISLKNHSLGTIANIEGEFVFKIDPEFTSDSVVISNIGFENKIIPIKEIQNQEVKIYLDKKLYNIQEVIVRTRDPYVILINALNKIKSNYNQTSSYRLTSFYRETVKKEEKVTSVSEALINIYKPNNKVFQSPQVKILKSRKTIDYSVKDSIMVKLKAGLEAILLLDIIEQEISFLNLGYFQMYDYKLEDISYVDGEDAYVIYFEPKKDAEIQLFTGKIYVNTKNLAIIGAEFYLDRDNLNKISNSLIIKKKWDINVKPKGVNYFVSYKKMDGQYYLKHIRGELTFRIRKRGELFGDDFKVSLEMATNDLETGNIEKYKSKETANTHKIFIEQIQEYDPDFWGDYNYIKPEEPIKETIKRLNSKIQLLENTESN